jgi:hypothetical protein
MMPKYLFDLQEGKVKVEYLEKAKEIHGHYTTRRKE